MKIALDAQLIEALAFLHKNGLTSQPKLNIPKVTSLGEEIKTVNALADAMGIDTRIAAAYAIQSDSPELKSSAKDVLIPKVNIFDRSITDYAHQISDKMVSEEKTVRLVRNSNGSKYFNQPVGSIIVAAGQKPLDALTAARNDVPGYEKVADLKGNAYYIGREGNVYVVVDATSKNVIYHTNAKNGEQASLYWLNSQVGGRAQGKAMDDDIEIKRQFTTLAVQKLGKQGHAFRNKNGSYSYPISTVADLKNAIQAFGRSAPEDRERLKAYIKKRAKQLQAMELIPDNWKSGEPMDLEVKKPVSAMDTTPLDHSTNKNWVEIAGQLPPYIRAIAHALIRDHDFTVSRAIATAISRIKGWLASPHTTAETKAKCSKALAQWEALRAKSKAKSIAKTKG